MKLLNRVPSQVNFALLKLNRLYNLKLPVFKFLGQRTNHSENKQIHDHPNFVWYVEMSSSGDMNQMPYHLTAFELTNQLLYINFPSLEHNIFQKDPKSTFLSSVVLRFRNLGNKTLRNCNLNLFYQYYISRERGGAGVTANKLIIVIQKSITPLN